MGESLVSRLRIALRSPFASPSAGSKSTRILEGAITRQCRSVRVVGLNDERVDAPLGVLGERLVSNVDPVLRLDLAVDALLQIGAAYSF